MMQRTRKRWRPRYRRRRTYKGAPRREVLRDVQTDDRDVFNWIEIRRQHSVDPSHIAARAIREVGITSRIARPHDDPIGQRENLARRPISRMIPRERYLPP
ncbi:hypothetical protein G6F60_015042 [Rhizopus arrhizus]|nr:hypothetical protein G6F60_015042 [Rhizopus arrhizus]